MPVWGWVLLIACLSVLIIGAVGLVVRSTHRLRHEEPLHGDVENIAAPLPLETLGHDELTERELDAERPRNTTVH
jgi:hypothetical protein